jgi:uroporphyrinogen-III synthase
VLGFAGRAGIGDASGAALGRVRGIIRGPKPVRALREVSLEADLQPEEPTTDGIISLLSRHDLAGGPLVCSSTARNPTCP